MGYFTELEMFILETIGKNSNRLPTRADFEQMLSAAGGSEVKLADALERLPRLKRAFKEERHTACNRGNTYSIQP